MHKINILILGPDSFISTLNELKPFLKFNLITNYKNFNNSAEKEFYGVICHEHEHDKLKKIINIKDCLKVLACSKKSKIKENFDHIINLPTSIKEMNRIIKDIFAKKRFNKNSTIEVKSYILDKNEKKLIKKNTFVILTEKEIQLIELFLNSEKPISKKNILSFVWNYSSDADTHTVETHIYRLRKKIKDKFLDEEFILNDKDGYYL